MPPPSRVTIRNMEHQNRKYPRLKEYNYSLPGYYYVTIHNEHGAPYLSQICSGGIQHRAAVRLTQTGRIAAEELIMLQQRYAYLRVDEYIMMPTHIHIIVRLMDGALPRPGLTDIVGAYKSLTTRVINAAQNTPGKRQFQRSFYETVIRSEAAYQSCWKYIDENPDKWGIREESEWDFRKPDHSPQEEL